LRTIGIAAVVVGGVLTIADATAVIHLKAKKVNGERMLIVDRKNDGKSDWL